MAAALTPHQHKLPRRALLLGLLAASLLLAALAPRLADAVQRNRLARQTAILCQQPGRAGQLAAGPGADWFEAALARCQDDDDAARAGWRASLQSSARRLGVIRAAAPLDAELARLAAATYPDNAQAHFWLGEAYREQGAAAAAIAAYEAGLALAPGDGLTWRILGDLYQAAGYDWQTVAATYDQACFRADTGKNGCLRAGRLYMEHEQYAAAAERYRQSLQQLPDHRAPREGLAAALLALGDATAARPYLEALAANGNEWAQEQLQELAIDD